MGNKSRFQTAKSGDGLEGWLRFRPYKSKAIAIWNPTTGTWNEPGMALRLAGAIPTDETGKVVITFTFHKERQVMIHVIKARAMFSAWVFDDPSVGLYNEAFVAGSDKILDEATKDIPNAREGVLVLFSEEPFPTETHVFHWKGTEGAGNVYVWREKNMEGWLCPALFRYFEKAPAELHVEFRQL